MSRHTQEQALVLTSRLVGEDNRIITLLGPERGIFEAMLYGGRKSKLRSLVSPWHSGTIWLYHDQSKGSTKISDFDPVAFRPGLRESIYKNMAASLATELVIKTHAANEPHACWTLLCGLLDGMELVEVTTPATPDTIRPNGTMRIRPEKVASALGNALPATIAGLLEGGRQ